MLRKVLEKILFLNLIIGATWLLPVNPAKGADGPLSIGTGFEYATGDYGTDETIDSVRVPLILDYYSERFDLQVEIPWIYQSGGTTVTMGGMRFPTDGGGDHQGRHGSGMDSSNDSSDLSESHSGLGDITLTGGLVLLDESDRFPLVRLLGYLKVPTADDEKGLGTGEFDFGAGLGLAKWLGNWTTYLEGMYVLPGSSSTYDPDNYWNFLASASYRLTDALRPGVSLSGGTAAFDGASAPLEFRVKISYWTQGNASFGAYLAKGLSNGSPDFGTGIFGFFNF